MGSAGYELRLLDFTSVQISDMGTLLKVNKFSGRLHLILTAVQRGCNEISVAFNARQSRVSFFSFSVGWF